MQLEIRERDVGDVQLLLVKIIHAPCAMNDLVDMQGCDRQAQIAKAIERW